MYGALVCAMYVGWMMISLSFPLPSQTIGNKTMLLKICNFNYSCSSANRLAIVKKKSPKVGVGIGIEYNNTIKPISIEFL